MIKLTNPQIKLPSVLIRYDLNPLINLILAIVLR